MRNKAVCFLAISFFLLFCGSILSASICDDAWYEIAYSYRTMTNTVIIINGVWSSPVAVDSLWLTNFSFTHTEEGEQHTFEFYDIIYNNLLNIESFKVTIDGACTDKYPNPPEPTPTPEPIYPDLELSGVEINDDRILTVAGIYSFSFPSDTESEPDLKVSGSFTQEATGRVTLTGTIRENEAATSITTRGKLKVKRKTDRVYANLNRKKIKAWHARVKLQLDIIGDELRLTIKYKKKWQDKIIRSASQSLVDNSRGAYISVGNFEERDVNYLVGYGTLILPGSLEANLTIKQWLKRREEDGSIIRRYKFKGTGRRGNLTCHFRFRAWMPTANANFMEIEKLLKRKVSYVNKVARDSINLVYE